MIGAADDLRPLRVLHIITRMIVGGAQENTLLSCALIDREQFPSEILAGRETGAEGELHTECRARGVTLWLEPSLVRDLNPWKDLVALVRLTAFMRSRRFSVVHVHTSKAGILGRVAARLAGVRVVIHTAHGWAFTREQSKPVFQLFVFLERWCARLCDAIIVVAAPDQDIALRHGVGRPEQFVLIRSGVELELYEDPGVSATEARTRAGVAPDAFVIGSVGRLSRQKAPLDLLEAFARVANRCDRAHLVFVGDGPLRGDLERAIADRGLGGRVQLLGLRRDVPQLLRAFDVFALSSRWEGLPRVFPQAMAAGLPIVSTRVGGATDAVKPGDNGWLVDVGDVSALGDRLLDLAGDVARARAMGARGRERVDEFSARRMVDQLAALYERLAAKKGLIVDRPRREPGAA